MQIVTRVLGLFFGCAIGVMSYAYQYTIINDTDYTLQLRINRSSGDRLESFTLTPGSTHVYHDKSAHCLDRQQPIIVLYRIYYTGDQKWSNALLKDNMKTNVVRYRWDRARINCFNATWRITARDITLHTADDATGLQTKNVVEFIFTKQ